MRKHDCRAYMVIGVPTLAAGSGLMIPLSLLLIVYGVTINENITRLNVPGLCLVFGLMACRGLSETIFGNRTSVGKARMSLPEKRIHSRVLIPVLLPNAHPEPAACLPGTVRSGSN